MLIVMTTVSDPAEADSLADKIIEARLAACVQILPRMTSVFYWKGGISREREHLVLIKTLEARYDELRQFIAENHSYEVPEIVALDAKHVSEGYLSWMTGRLT